ncbi:hypothetical protein [Tuwongella immobilis]|uniref:Uncharacterized protein n=1 Tax=Tuwongella immobilis TaxID=692036 RepID=A0A6C2YT02_9BACT|nr:hypothetical protein [Tuwongella immobilis]VIP04012.1 Putative pre-peptidase OS=Singulisphaera acidiphila (strain ATCC BAA-1392 / DSM 18658 / VKM B-2454 / MOB10) GN=Sinac_2823 PE=4 SV=1 [Tuwongella immobilis]VTS05391.1 Putative pre-peptidase OS=Singulisphaera acidiphila (strain ATCC BAA-1392 / DSM 18658 / VKM B-2454 / MOB10) GN=Sinac_2823 PE=4 SV=1 [Tuwongella immobilis]
MSINRRRRTIFLATWLGMSGIPLGGMIGPGMLPHLRADPPEAMVLFPAGGQRGTQVPVTVSGLYLRERCDWEMLGPGITSSPQLTRVKAVWFEGPLLPLPESQQKEDYPLTNEATVTIAADAPLGARRARLWTSQGGSQTPAFIVGDLPEIIESEQAGEPIPVLIRPPVTVNGRIFPREDVDWYDVALRAGDRLRVQADSAAFGSPVVPLVDLLHSDDRPPVEAVSPGNGPPILEYQAECAETVRIRIRDVKNQGGPQYVYRLTVTVNAHSSEKPADRSQLHATHALATPGLIGTHSVAVTAAEQWRVGVSLAGLHSALLPVVTIRDAQGQILKTIDTPPDRNGVVSAILPSTRPEMWAVEVRDRFRIRGGSAFRYRFIAERVVPDYRVWLPSSIVTLPRGGTVTIPVRIERIAGMSGPIRVRIDGLPEGVVAAGVADITGDRGEIRLTVAERIRIQSHRVRVVATAWQPISPITSLRRPIERIAQVEPLPGEVSPPQDIRLAIAMPTPFRIVGEFDSRLAPRGQLVRRSYRLERTGYDGPITVQLAEKQARHLQGVTGEPMIVPAGATRFDYGVMLPPWMEMGRTSRSCIVGIATIRDWDGSEHVVSFTSVQPNEQVIVIVQPNRLSVDVGQSVVTGRAGETISLPIRVRRASDLVGPVTVRLQVPREVPGIVADPITIPAGDESGQLRVQLLANASSKPVLPVVVVAEIQENGNRVLAEQPVTILANSPELGK